MTARPVDEAFAKAQERRAMRSGRTEDRVSVITFRVTPKERSILEMVARVQGESLSAFVRSSVMDMALAIISAGGGEEELLRCYSQISSDETAEKVAALRPTAGSPVLHGSAD